MDGQAIFLGCERTMAHRLVDAAPVGSMMVIKPARRSLDQNSLLWCLLGDVSRAKPQGRCHPPETWKALFCHACGHAVQFETGLNGQPFPTGYRTSRMSKAEMADLITFVVQWGDENGVAWSREVAA